jgi:hypothetical protein
MMRPVPTPATKNTANNGDLNHRRSMTAQKTLKRKKICFKKAALGASHWAGLCPARDDSGGEPRKAGQRNTRRAVSPAAKITPVWRASMPVLWKGRAGIFRRDVGDGEHAEVVIEGRVYRVRIGELG